MNKIFKLQFFDEIRIVNPAPHSIEDLRRKASELFGLSQPVFTYKDQEKQVITVDTPEEYSEIRKIRKKTVNIHAWEKADLKRKRELFRLQFKYMQPMEIMPENNGERTNNYQQGLPRTRATNSSRLNPIKIEDSDEDTNNQANFSVDEAPMKCKECHGEISDENIAVRCVGCNDFYHLECLDYRRQPQGDWYCDPCSELMLNEDEQDMRRRVIIRAKRAQYARK
ncbi:unnamed protein product [Blepharisma stoltei]|uniref:PHD-type domain-containing protein n=1 Tax=Blepharisma stoltei TaxID=1481888 RepID=A0AAU9K9Q4_9CILI|nr:unnamed protein product [Blepharisma stoltei]